ncbi:MAG: type IV pilus modification protein PilV [Gammaproteobacteria bacterium]|nr:type IV pilus modification protein PilV [Gammaproteobacteria bacterium]
MTTQRGFSLIEVLIATVVLSIGVLGISGLLTVSRQSTFDAVQRSTAAEMAYALLEQMRSNDSELEFYVTAGTLGRGSRGAEPAACNDPNNPCESDAFAAHKLWEWERMLDAGAESTAAGGSGGLVSPSACVDGPVDGSAGEYVVAVAWRGRIGLSDPTVSDCGAGSGLYGDNDEFRRVVVIRSYMDPQI